MEGTLRIKVVERGQIVQCDGRVEDVLPVVDLIIRSGSRVTMSALDQYVVACWAVLGGTE